jgi:hypothetical protein
MRDFKAEGQALLLKVLEANRDNDGGGERAAFILCQALKDAHHEGAGVVPSDPGIWASWDGRAQELNRSLGIRQGEVGLLAQNLALAYAGGKRDGKGEAAKLTEAGKQLFRDMRDSLETLRCAVRLMLSPKRNEAADLFATVALETSEPTMHKLIKAIDE